MKIILSRKGIDSASGGMASPILPCGCFCSIPIPDSQASGLRYSDIWFGRRTLMDICSQLDPQWEDKFEFAHLDPDLRHDALVRRLAGWRPAFGQSKVAASHLQNNGVDKGDLFVFFGWFRKTKAENGKLRFDPDDRHGRHMIYGWLEVGTVVDVDAELPNGDLSFLADHPHLHFATKPKPNLVYVGSQSGLRAGLFGKQADDVSLTRLERLGCRRSIWQFPLTCESLLRQNGLSYHRNKELQILPDGIIFRAAGRGQEFIFDGREHPDARDYFTGLIPAMDGQTSCQHTF